MRCRTTRCWPRARSTTPAGKTPGAMTPYDSSSPASDDAFRVHEQAMFSPLAQTGGDEGGYNDYLLAGQSPMRTPLGAQSPAGYGFSPVSPGYMPTSAGLRYLARRRSGRHEPLDWQQRPRRHLAGVQPHVAAHLWRCDKSVVFANLAELQSRIAQLLAIVAGGCRILADEPAHEPDEPHGSLRRCHQPAVLARLAQVLADEPELQPGQSCVHAHVAGLLAHLACHGGPRRCQGLQPGLARLLAHLAAVLARFTGLLADVAAVLTGFAAVLAYLAAILSHQPGHGRRCVGTGRRWTRRRRIAAPQPHVQQAGMAALRGVLRG
ncbi:hypothetical protein L1887_60030 [Cichorium endivia]|nr:hypothetical protein L1887_60030 [Cichorium endivia]